MPGTEITASNCFGIRFFGLRTKYVAPLEKLLFLHGLWARNVSKTLCRIVVVILNKTVLDSPLISLWPPVDPCMTRFCISDIFKHAQHSLWHFVFPLQQRCCKVIWKDRRRDPASSGAQAHIRSLRPAALLMNEGSWMFSHITVSLIKAHPWVL